MEIHQLGTEYWIFRQPTPGHYEWVDVGNFYNKELEVSQILCSYKFFLCGLAKWKTIHQPIPDCLWFKSVFQNVNIFITVLENNIRQPHAFVDGYG